MMGRMRTTRVLQRAYVTMFTVYRLVFIILPVIILSSPSAYLLADEQTATFRVYGLFQPDRVDDLRQLIADKLPELAVMKIDYEHATAEFRFDPITTLRNAKPEQYRERLDGLLRPASSGAFSLLPLSSVPTEQWQRIEIEIAGLDCKACSAAAYDAVAKLDGVERATASFRERRLVAWVDPTKIDRAKLIEALLKKRVDVPMPSK